MKLWTTVHDDPSMQRLSPTAFRAYINALSFAGRHETGGSYERVGSETRAIRELVECGKFQPIEGQPTRYLIHGWEGRQATSLTAEERTARARHAAEVRWSCSPDANPVLTSTPLAMPEKRREEKKREEKKEQHLAPRKRDALFEVVAEVCGVDWNQLTGTARGSLNKAVAQLRPLNPDPEDVRFRASNWPYDVPLTPPALAKHWPALSKIHIPKPKNNSVSRALSMAADLERGTA